MNAKDQTTIGETIKVLLVENNPVDTRVLTRMLEEVILSPHDVRHVESLHAAFEVLGKEKIDVVVLDLNLPDSSGLASLEALNEKFPNVAVVVNTGAYQDDVGLKTMGMGAQDFIIKGKYTPYGLAKAIYYARERKRIERDLITAYQRLQEAQNQLIQAEKMNVVGRLASGIAHEVKNPLATIIFGVTYLSEKLKTDDEKINLTIKSIRESAKKANDIITDLLDYSSLSRLNKNPEDIHVILETSLSLLHHLVDKQQIQVSKEFGSQLPRVSIDRNRLEQVFVNLLLNAIYAVGEGGKLRLKTYSRIWDGNLSMKKNFKGKTIANKTPTVCIEIEDNGSGIAEDNLDKIFDPFFTTRRARGGVGLGLSVAQNIVEMHEGGLWIENRPEGGARAGVVLQACAPEVSP